MSSMQDPFYLVKEEVTQSLHGISALHERWKVLLDTTNTATNEEFKWTLNEIKNAMKSIEWDLSDLEETINIVETNRAKFKINQQELEDRKSFINGAKQRIEDIKGDLNSVRTKGIMEKHQRDMLMKQNRRTEQKSKLEEAIQQDNQRFIDDQHGQQQTIMRQQDEDLTQLEGTVGTLRNMGITIGNTLQQHETLINEIDHDVTKADSSLKGAVRKLNALIDSTSDNKQLCIIVILILVLVGLVVLVVYV